MKRKVKTRVDNKSTESKETSNPKTTILDDMETIMKLVNKHYKLKEGSYD